MAASSQAASAALESRMSNIESENAAKFAALTEKIEKGLEENRNTSAAMQRSLSDNILPAVPRVARAKPVDEREGAFKRPLDKTILVLSVPEKPIAKSFVTTFAEQLAQSVATSTPGITGLDASAHSAELGHKWRLQFENEGQANKALLSCKYSKSESKQMGTSWRPLRIALGDQESVPCHLAADSNPYLSKLSFGTKTLAGIIKSKISEEDAARIFFIKEEGTIKYKFTPLANLDVSKSGEFSFEFNKRAFGKLKLDSEDVKSAFNDEANDSANIEWCG